MKTEESRILAKKQTPADGKLIDQIIEKGDYSNYTIPGQPSTGMLRSEQTTTLQGKQTNDESVQQLDAQRMKQLKHFTSAAGSLSLKHSNRNQGLNLGSQDVLAPVGSNQSALINSDFQSSTLAGLEHTYGSPERNSHGTQLKQPMTQKLASQRFLTNSPPAGPIVPLHLKQTETGPSLQQNFVPTTRNPSLIGGTDSGVGENILVHQGSIQQYNTQSNSPQHSASKANNLKFGLNPKTKIGNALLPHGLGGGPMKGIHPSPFPQKRAKFEDQTQRQNDELHQLLLPKIKPRKLEDLLDDKAENPFRIQKQSERLLVFREKQREIEKLESLKSRIEHKYLRGPDLFKSLTKRSSSKSGSVFDQKGGLTTDRTGMIREVDQILPQKMPSKYRANSLLTGGGRNRREQAITTTFRSKSNIRRNLFADPSKNSIQVVQETEQDPAMLSDRSPRSLSLAKQDSSMIAVSPREESRIVGKARFQTPMPNRANHPLEIINDPLRYLNQKNSDQKETVNEYIESSRKILHHNISILDKQQEVEKLMTMIDEEEKKLVQAKKSFQEDTQRFNTYLFETKQVGDKLEEQFKDANDTRRKLEEEVTALRSKIEDTEAEINYKDEVCSKYKDNMAFLNWIIKEFRPRLMKGQDLQPLSDEDLNALKMDTVFLTQFNSDPSKANSPAVGQVAAFDSVSEIGSVQEEKRFKMKDHIPISHIDVHKFIQEICDENLFLINLLKEEEEAAERLHDANTETMDKLNRQITQTSDTVELLTQRKKHLTDNIQAIIRLQSATDHQPDSKKESKYGAKEQPKVELKFDPDFPHLIEKLLLILSMLVANDDSGKSVITDELLQLSSGHSFFHSSHGKSSVSKRHSRSLGPVKEPDGLSRMDSMNTIQERPSEEGDSQMTRTMRKPNHFDDTLSPPKGQPQLSKNKSSSMQTPKSRQSMRSNSVSAKHAGHRKLIEQLDYHTVLKIIRQIEDRLNLVIEVFEMVQVMGKHDMKVKIHLADILKQADKEHKQKMNLEMKEREVRLAQEKYEKNIAKMAEKDAIKRQFGKIKMERLERVRHNKQTASGGRRDRIDPDVIKYLGEGIDLNKIPDETPEEEKRRREEEAEAAAAKLQQAEEEEDDLDF